MVWRFIGLDEVFWNRRFVATGVGMPEKQVMIRVFDENDIEEALEVIGRDAPGTP